MMFLDLQFLALVAWMVMQACIVWWAIKDSIPEERYQSAKWLTIANTFFWIGVVVVIEITRQMLWER